MGCADLQGLPAGVYHFDPQGPTLTRLREGDHRGHLVRAASREPAVARAPVVFVLTGIPWRTAWKYTERGYRHLFWDAGMILANILALAASACLPVRVVLGFADAEVSVLLGLEERREFPLCLVAIGAADSEVLPAAEPPRKSRSGFCRYHGPSTSTRASSRRTTPAAWMLRRRLGSGGASKGAMRRSNRLHRCHPIRRPTPSRTSSAGAALPGRARSDSRHGSPDDPRASHGRHPDRLRAWGRPSCGAIPDLERGPGPGSGRLRLPRRRTPAHGARQLPPGGRIPLSRTGARRDGGSNHFLMTDLPRTLDALGARGYRAAQAGGRHLRRAPLPGRVRVPFRCHRPHVLRRRGCRVLLARRGGQELRACHRDRRESSPGRASSCGRSAPAAADGAPVRRGAHPSIEAAPKTEGSLAFDAHARETEAGRS